MLKLPPPLLTVRTRARVFPQMVALRLNTFSHNLHEIRPNFGGFQTHLFKIDDVSLVRVRGVAIDLFAADVRKNSLGILRELRDQSAHFGDGAGHAAFIEIVEGEALTVDHRSSERPISVGSEHVRIVIDFALNEECIHVRDGAPIQHPAAGPLTSKHMHDADDNSCLAGPNQSTSRNENLAAVIANPAQSRCPCVTLTNCVGCNQAERPILLQKLKTLAIEMGDNVRVSVRLVVHR
jgi:hypothetical protein